MPNTQTKAYVLQSVFYASALSLWGTLLGNLDQETKTVLIPFFILGSLVGALGFVLWDRSPKNHYNYMLKGLMTLGRFMVLGGGASWFLTFYTGESRLWSSLGLTFAGLVALGISIRELMVQNLKALKW